MKTWLPVFLTYIVLPLWAGATFAAFCRHAHSLEGIYRHLYVHTALQQLLFACVPLALLAISLRAIKGKEATAAAFAIALAPVAIFAIGTWVLDGQLTWTCIQTWFHELPWTRGLAVAGMTSTTVAFLRAAHLQKEKPTAILKPACQLLRIGELAAMAAIAFLLQAEFLKWCVLEHDPLS